MDYLGPDLISFQVVSNFQICYLIIFEFKSFNVLLGLLLEQLDCLRLLDYFCIQFLIICDFDQLQVYLGTEIKLLKG